MSGAKHTPGPWVAKMSKYHEESLLVQAGMPSNRVLVRFGSASEQLDDIDRANARLIAAAPDMLAALKGAELQLRAHKIDCRELDEIRAAIAKAEGRSS